MFTVTRESLAKRSFPVPSRGWVVLLWARWTWWLGTIIVGLFIFLAIFGPLLIVSQSPFKFHLEKRFHPPSRSYPLGTDNFGRDIASRIIAGSRSILLLAGSSTLLSILMGTLVGITSGYYGGLLDEIVMRVIDGLMSVPSMLLALLIISTLGPETVNLIIGISVIYTPMVSRVMRSAVLQEKVKDYVAAAQVRGESTLYILFREILPNAFAPMIVEGSIRFCYAILLSASLGFLGLGVQPPTPDWGLMVNEGRNFLLTAPWMVIAPAAAISVLVIGVNLVGDGIQQMLGITAGSRRM